MQLERASGILVHPTSFPSDYGIGDLGDGAYAFVDFLSRGKQKLWQVLPLCPTSFGDSPYQSFSTFAGNPLLISPKILIKEGYLTEEELADVPAFDRRRVEFGEVIQWKMGLYRKAFEQFKVSGTASQQTAFSRFKTSHKEWLNDFALFMSLKSYFIEERRLVYESPEYVAYKASKEGLLSENEINDYFYGAVWNTWPADLLNREKHAMAEWTKKLADEIELIKFLQFEFFREWTLLRHYANKLEIQIVGDLPIFVALDSADVWANPSLFYLDEQGNPTSVAGVPPDYFSETGQLWGNPLYNWSEHKDTDYKWWIKRIEQVLSIVDIVRIDHFRGFESYWSVKYGEKTAINGKWNKGPGKQLFTAIEKALGDLPIIAEDLGIITESVTKLRVGLELPGMIVLQFAFDTDGKNVYLPHSYQTSNMVVYSGTHDNDTTIGWYAGATEKAKDYYRRYMNVSGDDVAWDFIRLAYASSAALAIVPIQDVMNLGTEDRMNTPGTANNCWQFRYTADMLKDEYADRLLYLSKLFDRVDVEPEVEETDIEKID